MGKHSAPHVNYDGTPLPRVHFPGPWREGGTTPCGLPFMTRNMKGELVTAVNTAGDWRLVDCEICFAKEDIKHRQDFDYGAHSAPHPVADAWLREWVARSPLLAHLLGDHTSTPAPTEPPVREDVGAGIEVLVDTPDITLWTGR